MEIHPQVLIFAGSLAAIFALAGLAWIMRLGGSPILSASDDAALAAAQTIDGFTPSQIAIDERGTAAILRDDQGRIVVIKRHGNRFAGRLLTRHACATAAQQILSVQTGETRFGSVEIRHRDAATWAEAINALCERRDA